MGGSCLLKGYNDTRPVSHAVELLPTVSLFEIRKINFHFLHVHHTLSIIAHTDLSNSLVPPSPPPPLDGMWRVGPSVAEGPRS